MSDRVPIRVLLSRGAQVIERQVMPLGAATMLLIAAFTFVGFKALNGVPFQNRYELKAVMPPDTPPLKKGDIVRVAGQRAGSVTDVGPVRNGLLVTMQLTPSNAPVGRNARATVRQKAAGGVFYVDVTRGNYKTEPVPEATTIPRARTSAGADLLTVVSKFDSRFRSAMARTTQVSGEAFINRGGDLNEALADLPEALTDGQKIIRSATPRPEAFSDLLREIGRTGNALSAPGGEELAGLATDGARGLAPFAEGASDLQDTLQNLRPFEDRALQTLPVADELLSDATPMARELRPAVAALRTALPPTTTLLRTGGTLEAQAKRLEVASGPVLKQGIKAVPQLRAPAALLPPITADAKTLATEIAPFSREAFVFGDSLVRGSAMVAPASDITSYPELRMQRVNFIFTCMFDRNPYPKPGQSHTDRSYLGCPRYPVGSK